VVLISIAIDGVGRGGCRGRRVKTGRE